MEGFAISLSMQICLFFFGKFMIIVQLIRMKMYWLKQSFFFFLHRNVSEYTNILITLMRNNYYWEYWRTFTRLLSLPVLPSPLSVELFSSVRSSSPDKPRECSDRALECSRRCRQLPRGWRIGRTWKKKLLWKHLLFGSPPGSEVSRTRTESPCGWGTRQTEAWGSRTSGRPCSSGCTSAALCGTTQGPARVAQCGEKGMPKLGWETGSWVWTPSSQLGLDLRSWSSF